MLVECKFEKRQDTHGNTVREWLVPDGFTVIDTYTPHSTPWDYHGMKHQRELRHVLAEVCDVALPNIDVTLGHPFGTGPGGAVRLGDAMTPGTFRLAVPTDKVGDAQKAITAHKAAIEEWLLGKGEMPLACRG